MILGIYTASGVEVALDSGDQAIALASTAGALESVLHLTMDALRQKKAGLDNVSLIGVCTGPGSFTGLRIGVSFAKSLAQGRDLPITGISSYDVAALGVQEYPLITVARGKPGYYYARVTERPDTPSYYVQGDREVIERAAAGVSPATRIVGPDFSPKQPGECARAVVELARGARERGEASDWTNIAIDYGQRPNAVVNWEKRHGGRTGGQKFYPANQRRNEGPAPHARHQPHEE